MTWTAEEPPVIAAASPWKRGVAVIRLVLLLLLTLVLFPLYLIAAWIGRPFGARVHFGVQVLWARLGLALCGLRLRVEGARMRHGGALVANHSSWLDIFTLLAAGRVNFVSKAEVRNWPGVGFLAACTGTMFIERRAAEAQAQTLEMGRRMQSGERLAFFPEGTSTDGLRVLPFKSPLFAAFLAEGLRELVWVQPVTIVYEAPDDEPAALYGFWGDMDFGRHIWTVLSHSRGGRVTLVYHRPLRVADHPDRKQLARMCGDAVRTGMDEVRAGLR